MLGLVAGVGVGVGVGVSNNRGCGFMGVNPY
jgi:hypothetical protein